MTSYTPLTFKKVVIFVFSLRHRLSSLTTSTIFIFAPKSNKLQAEPWLVLAVRWRDVVPSYSPDQQSGLPPVTPKLKRHNCEESVYGWPAAVAQKVSPPLPQPLSLAIASPRAKASRQRSRTAPASLPLGDSPLSALTSANAIGVLRCRRDLPVGRLISFGDATRHPFLPPHPGAQQVLPGESSSDVIKVAPSDVSGLVSTVFVLLAFSSSINFGETVFICLENVLMCKGVCLFCLICIEIFVAFSNQ